MASTVLEQTRGLHEDVERLERIIVKDLKQETKTHKEKLMQNHRVRKRLDQMQESARKLVKVYDDEDRARRDDIEALGAPNPTGAYSKFYDRLKEIRDYHRRHMSMDITEAENDEEMLKEEPFVEFTGEESLGRYLDLHELHMKFMNAKSFGRKLDYHEYLTCFSDFTAIPKHSKFSQQYRDYVEQLLNYLCSFYERTQPLAQYHKQLKKTEDEFGARWDAGQVAGWEDKGLGPSSTTPPIDLEDFESVEELESIGAERLKEALTVMGLKCGGTARERAERLFATKGRPLESLDRKLFARGGVPSSALSAEEAATRGAAARSAAVLEVKTQRMAELLTNVISDTRGRVEKKQAQTYEEMQAELEEAEAELAEELSDEEDEFIYNPLKLPLGWDGKPIPYWLYKLHGLNQEFKCEICGNYSYWGRRAFEKHFKEWRHQNGMRAMGIPNNKMFYEVTKIDDALSLWRTIQERARGSWNQETDEELEDVDGNVYNKKTYEDMRRQGLI